MKKILSILLLLIMIFSIVSCGSNSQAGEKCNHIDSDDDGNCDICLESVIVVVDLYAINDLHGKFLDSDTQIGVDELSTFINRARLFNDHVVFLSSGDMWQGSAESNSTYGAIITEWMNYMNVSSMTLGNHEFDWGVSQIESNLEIAKFPFLAINVYNRSTNKPVSFCQPSTIVDFGDLQVGIIGAIGDCLSSISGDKVEDIYFKTGDALTNLVKAESENLKNQGADIIVYSIHSGYDSNVGGVGSIKNSQLDDYYDLELSNGYVDVVFEAHTHRSYVLGDSSGVYHLQGGGDNKGISHAAVSYNIVTGTKNITTKEFVSTSKYASLSDDKIVNDLMDKYKENVSNIYNVLGTNVLQRDGGVVRKLTAKLYYEAGIEKWGKDYDIALAGAFISVRSPGYIPKGEVKYSDLQTILPFDNTIALCKVDGEHLKKNFVETTNKNYGVYFDERSSEIIKNIDPKKTYYIISDSYSYTYAPNALTVIEILDENTFARDLIAEYIINGGLETK